MAAPGAWISIVAASPAPGAALVLGVLAVTVWTGMTHSEQVLHPQDIALAVDAVRVAGRVGRMLLVATGTAERSSGSAHARSPRCSIQHDPHVLTDRPEEVTPSPHRVDGSHPLGDPGGVIGFTPR